MPAKKRKKSHSRVSSTKELGVVMPNNVRSELHKDVHRTVVWISLLGLTLAIVLVVYANYSRVISEILAMSN
jgi:hypothetical protein